MNFDVFAEKISLGFDTLYTTVMAALFYVVGVTLRRRVAILKRFCIPSGVIGGLIVAVTAVLLRTLPLPVELEFNATFQYPAMLFFFTSIGLGGSLSRLKSGGAALAIYLAACWAMAVFQNILGYGVASAMGIHPALGIMAGAVSLEGGHAMAAAFGPTAEYLGVAGAQAVAIAAATYGLIAGALLGGPLAEWLIRKSGVVIEASGKKIFRSEQEASEMLELVDSFEMFRAFTLALCLMALGNSAADAFNSYCRLSLGWSYFTLPGYVGTMFAALIFRNVNDLLGLVRINRQALLLIQDMALGIFLTMATMTLRIWDVYSLAVPLIVILLLQTAAVLLVAALVIFPLLGRDYDAAVICAGFIGHGLGAAPNAVSNMSSVCDNYKTFSYKAFFVVPLCGTVLIDLVSIPNILWFIGFCTR